MKLARRVASIQPSPTLAITSKAKAMKAEGIDVVGFGAGEPDFDTPEHIKAVAKKALDEGYTKYTPVPGSPQLKDAVIAKFKRDNGLEYKRENIIVSVGAKHSIYNVGQALFEEGDEIIIPAPYWVSFEQAITPRTKCVILNSPSNPTGSAYTVEELKRIADVIVRRDVTVLSDDIYEKLVYDNFRFESIASFGEEIKKRTIVVNGLSKAYSMTGWRIGYLAADKDLVAAINNIQSQSTSNPVSFCDKAAIEALNGPQDFLKDFLPPAAGSVLRLSELLEAVREEDPVGQGDRRVLEPRGLSAGGPQGCVRSRGGIRGGRLPEAVVRDVDEEHREGDRPHRGGHQGSPVGRVL
jgi:aspartate aminotransferase